MMTIRTDTRSKLLLCTIGLINSIHAYVYARNIPFPFHVQKQKHEPVI